ncbi:MAG TPA: hypothetical protein VFO56_09660 [Gaiellaceae bacterium]|nr:hypothetical protein [Gaiellaceae bacterium]
MKKSFVSAIVAVVAFALLLATASIASARDGDVRVAGTCSGASSTKIKLGPRDGRIEVEFEVDQNRNGVVWRVSLTQNGATVFSGTAKTKAPSGSFEVRRILSKTAGLDTVRGTAVNPATGETCTAVASV